MKNCNVNMGNTAPYAYITKGKQRVKQYIDTVYLQNGDEFEIELFNPTSNKVLAEITVNDTPIGSGGIVIRPGERVYLERFIDVDKKFLFETYYINNSKESKKSIEKNGIVSVKFYDEQKPNFPFHGGTLTTNNPIWYDNITTGNPTCGSYTLTADNQPNIFYCTSFSNSENIKKFVSPRVNEVKATYTPKIETGRVEKGNKSNQNFQLDSTNFNAWYTWQSTWKILPISQKVVTSNEIKVYCVECGGRRKKQSFKFCPNCGTKY